MKSGFLHLPVTNPKKLERHTMLPFCKILTVIKQINLFMTPKKIPVFKSFICYMKIWSVS